MTFIYLLIGIIIGGTILYFIQKPKLENKIEIDNKIKQANQELEEKNKLYKQQYDDIIQKYNQATELRNKEEQEYNTIRAQKKELKSSIKSLQTQAEESAQAMYMKSAELANEKMSVAANKMRLEYLDAERQAQEEYLNSLIELEEEFNSTMTKTQNAQMELDKLLAQIRAATAAANREKQIQEKPEDFTINLSTGVLEDIKKLYVIKKELNNPRILLMLIWTSFIKTPLDILCDKTLGNSEVCGIYKLTNLITNEMYVGQSTNIRDRLRTHFKHGLGIDTPTTNKLYGNMQEYGVWNFSVELLESCPREELNAKEKYYIELYSSDASLNSTKGNN